MKIEELKNEFSSIYQYYSWEVNSEKIRNEIIRAFTEMIRRLQNEGHFMYTLMKKFVDTSTPEMIDQGAIEINVELSNDKIVSLEEYCEIMTDKEKYEKLLYDSILAFKPKEMENEEIKETDLDFLIGKKLIKVVPTTGDDETTTDLIFDDGTIVCISNDFYIAEN